MIIATSWSNLTIWSTEAIFDYLNEIIFFWFDKFKFLTLTYTTTNKGTNIWITTNSSVLTWIWNTWIRNYCTKLTCESIGTRTSVCCRWNWKTCSTVWTQIIRTWICEYLTSWSAKSILNYYLNFKLNKFKTINWIITWTSTSKTTRKHIITCSTIHTRVSWTTSNDYNILNE